MWTSSFVLVDMAPMDATLTGDRFEAHRARLREVALRMLGSAAEADDAVQETWLRFSRAGTSGVDNVGAWLTTVVARICLDMLRTRRSRREEPGHRQREEEELAATDVNPSSELCLADSMGVALLVVLEMLAPAERIAFVLHDLFDLSFDEIAPIVERSPTATRQLASRARRRVRGASAVTEADRARQREVVAAFLAASREGNFDALLALLDPDVVLRADREAVEASAARASHGAPALAAELRGARAVAAGFKGRAQAARAALVDGLPGAVWALAGRPRVAFAFTLSQGRIVAIEVIMEASRLAELDLVVPTLDEDSAPGSGAGVSGR
jgi:RNA polymerase sigma factor (sigma-70 family)